MRNPFIRALLAALVILVIIMVTWQSDTTADVRAQILAKAGIKSGPGSQVQRPLVDEDAAPAAVSPNQEPTHTHQMDCGADVDHLRIVKDRFSLDEKFQYLKRYVRFTRTDDVKRKSMNMVKQNLLEGSFKIVDINGQSSNDKCGEPLDVQVPKSGLPSTVNASDFMFGVSTTYARFMDPSTTPINEWIFWLTDSRGHTNGGKLLLMLLDASDEELQEVANLLGDVGIDVDVYHSDSAVEMAVRYLTLVPTLFTHRETPKKKWLVTCDDDTFFPSMHALIERFETYDHTREMYIGTLSEDVGALDRHGSQAFGGAGVFLSVPMAERITNLYKDCTAEQKILESNSGWGPQGDILLRKCIYENTETRLTSVWDLWQLDFYGDPSGFYEWGIKPLSLHHYRGGGWHIARPGQITKIAHTCGEDCSMMRFQTTDDYIISGYSVAHYPSGITFDHNQMEGTLYAAPENKGWNLDFVFGPQRPSLLKTGRKIAWELQESEVKPDGSILQTYTRKKDDWRWVNPDETPMSNIDGVIELVWIPS
ncbi:family 31 glycosyltransferase [Stachybotrys elegans]|uniref:Family 31 glycosyltransferase n=1 Tax=Stachybotrys elegans TaxID=80388 RepID=A0A8K0WRW0_9HYPO|nr:family 31 glycosyltransferase [Stachybotrys elegans]